METESLVLNAQLRTSNGKAHLTRKAGLIPAEYYGNGVKNQTLSLPYQDFRRLYKRAGTNTVIELKVEGGKNANVLIHQVDFEPVMGTIQHVELTNIRMDEEVTTMVAIRLEGQAPAVKELAGMLLQNVDEIEVRCLPAHLIHEVVLNVESLVDFNAALYVSDIQLPSTVTLLSDPEMMVASVAAPRAEEVDEAPVADVASVEVTGQKPEGAEGEGKSE